MQAPLALGFVTAVAVWLSGGGALWFAGGLLIGAVAPYTLIGAMLANRKLLAPGRDPRIQ